MAKGELDPFDEFINPSLERFKSELQYDAKSWLIEQESNAALKGPFDLMITFALICAQQVTAILISSRNLKRISALGRASFAERFLLCSGLYILSAVNQRLRNMPDDEWDRWPVTRGSHCFEVDELSTLFALDVFCTDVEISSLEWIFRWVWSVTGRPVDCDPVLYVIRDAVSEAGVLNYPEWCRKFSLDIFTDSELFPKSGDVQFPEIIPDEYDLETELDRVRLELRYEHYEATAGLTKSGGQGEKIRIDPADFKKSKCWKLLQDLCDDDLRQGIVVNERRHGKHQPQTLRRILRKKAKDKRNPRPQYVKIAENIKPVRGKNRTYKLGIPYREIDCHRNV